MVRMHPPRWGNFVFHADWDLLSFAWLYHGGLREPASYHATQAVEKYLKALALSILDPDGETETALNNRWLRTHDLVALAERCAVGFPLYGRSETLALLTRFSEFDQAVRYPWVEKKHGNGFTSADLLLLRELVERLRMDLPIKVDDYPLGVLVRGHHHGRPEASTSAYFVSQFRRCVAALRVIFPQLHKLVRW